MEGYELFKKEILKMTRIDLNAYKEKQMRRRIETLAAKTGSNTFEEYIAIIRTDKDKFNEFINFMTINVSEFYRNPDQWKILDEKIIPDLINKFGRHLKIWSAACATGDEPYSLVMAFSKHIPLSNIRIFATDLDKSVIEQARIGLYNTKSIANVPVEFKKKYFTQVGNSYQISDEIKKRVEFKQHNLLKDPYPRDCNLIVCRNVVIYFTDEAKNEIYRKFYESLAPQGKLFIGSTEQIINYKTLGYEKVSSFFFTKP